MLKNIDSLLNADVLYALRAMGHGDALVRCDANFPADSVARQTERRHPARLKVTAGLGRARLLRMPQTSRAA